MDENLSEWLQVDFKNVNGFLEGVPHVGHNPLPEVKKLLLDPGKRTHSEISIQPQQAGAETSALQTEVEPLPPLVLSPPLMTSIATQGRYANQRGVEYTTSYVLLYKGETTAGKLKKYTGSDQRNQVSYLNGYFTG